MKYVLLSLHVLCAILVFSYALNEIILWLTWCLSMGITSYALFFRKPGKITYVLIGFAILITPVSVIIRALPIYALGWDDVEKMEIMKDGLTIEVFDPNILSDLKLFGRQGSYGTIMKCGSTFPIRVWRRGVVTQHYVHWNCIGNSPGGFIQTVFIPAKDGFHGFFNNVLKMSEDRR